MKLSKRLNAETVTAKVKMPVVRLVQCPIDIIKPPLTLNSINTKLIIIKITNIATVPDPRPERSGGLNSICDEMQTQTYRKTQNCHWWILADENNADITCSDEFSVCVSKLQNPATEVRSAEEPESNESI